MLSAAALPQHKPRHTSAPHFAYRSRKLPGLARALNHPYDGNSRRRSTGTLQSRTAYHRGATPDGHLLRNLRRSGSTDDLPELRQLAERLESQHTNLERLVQHADRSIAQLQRLGTLGERVSALEKQLGGWNTWRLGSARRSSRSASSREPTIASPRVSPRPPRGSSRSVARPSPSRRPSPRRYGSSEELSGFLAMQQPFREMRREMDELQAQSQNFRNDMARVRSEHETTVAGYRTATSRLETFEGDWQRVSRAITETEHRIAGLEQPLGDLAPVTETMAQTRRQVAAAKLTTDQTLPEGAAPRTAAGTNRSRHRQAGAPDRPDAAGRYWPRTTGGDLRTAAALRTQLEGLSEGHRVLQDQSSASVDRMVRVEAGVTASERTPPRCGRRWISRWSECPTRAGR